VLEQAGSRTYFQKSASLPQFRGLSVALPAIEAMEFLNAAAGNDGHFRPVRECEWNRL